MSTLTEEALGPVEKSLIQHAAADAYDWDAVSALEQIERVRQLAIEAAVREHRRRTLENETGTGPRPAAGGDKTDLLATERQL